MRILFVDDDLTVLDDMRRQVHGKKNFQASYAASVDEGLAFIEHDPIDVLVTALRMPKKDGVVLLEAVQEKRPACVRIVFTGESNTERFFRCVPLAHRMVSKPCVPETLIQLVEQTFELRRRISDPRVMRVLSGIGALPPQPRVYMEIEKALKTDKSLQEIGQLVARDQAITVKILQLVNSAWFPTRRRIDSCQQAVAYLGSAHTKSLVLSLGTACEMSRLHPDATQAIDAVGEHAEQVAGIAQRFAQALGLSRDRQEEVFCAAILHDIGKLLVITGFPDIAKKIEERAKNGHAARLSAERGLLEATHAELGARLLSLWGVPEAAIDAACRHEDSGVDAELSETTFIVRLANLAADAARDGGESEELTAARAEAARRGWTSALPALDAQVPASTH